MARDYSDVLGNPEPPKRNYTGVLEPEVQQAPAAQQAPPAIENSFGGIAKSVATGAGRGVTGTLGLPFDLLNMAVDEDNVSFDEFEGMTDQEKWSSEDWRKKQSQQNKIDARRDLLTAWGNKGHEDQLEKVTGEWHDPETTAEKYASRAAEFAVPFAGGKAKDVGKMMLGGGVAGLASEGAGQLTEGTKLEPYARVAGGLLGGSTAAWATHTGKANAARIARDALKDVSEAEIIAAKNIQESGVSSGIPLMGHESINSDVVTDLASDVMASPSGGSMNTWVNQRPGQVDRATGDLGDQVGPKMDPQTAHEVGRQGAEDVIVGGEAARRNITEPLYEGSKSDPIPAAPVQGIIDDLGAVQSTRGGPVEAVQGQMAQRLTGPDGKPVSTIGQAGDTVAEFNRRVKSDAYGNDPIDAATAKEIKPIMDELAEIIFKNSPDRKVANTYYSALSPAIAKLRNGDMGAIAESKNLRSALAILVDPKHASPETIKFVYTHMNRHDPKAFPALVRAHIDDLADVAAKDSLGGRNPKSGAKFRSEIAGTPNKRANLDALLEGVADAQGVDPVKLVKGFNTVLEVMMRTAVTKATGSPTASRAARNAEASKGGIAGPTADALNITEGSILSRVGKNAKDKMVVFSVSGTAAIP